MEIIGKNLSRFFWTNISSYWNGLFGKNYENIEKINLSSFSIALLFSCTKMPAYSLTSNQSIFVPVFLFCLRFLLLALSALLWVFLGRPFKFLGFHLTQRTSTAFPNFDTNKYRKWNKYGEQKCHDENLSSDGFDIGWMDLMVAGWMSMSIYVCVCAGLLCWC